MLPAQRTLTRKRILLALAIAVTADFVQIGLGPFGWTFVDEILDVAVMFLMTALIGFHPAFLPTFVIEVIPVVDMLPTWTGCVMLVVAFRRKQQQPAPPKVPPAPPGVIDI